MQLTNDDTLENATAVCSVPRTTRECWQLPIHTGCPSYITTWTDASQQESLHPSTVHSEPRQISHQPDVFHEDGDATLAVSVPHLQDVVSSPTLNYQVTN